MKFIFSGVLFLVFFTVFGQNSRYYPSLSKIFNSEDDKKMSKDFGYFDNWINQNAKGIFYKNLQTSVSGKGDSSFQSLDLIFLKQNFFKLGNSGIKLIFNGRQSDFSSPISVQVEQSYKILSYLREFDLYEYDPKNLKQKFNLGLIIFNVSEETVLKEFLDTFVKDNKNDKIASIQRLKEALKNQAKIDIVIDQKNEKSEEDIMENIISQIQEQTDRLSSDILYDIYISSKEKERERINFELFFGNFIHENPDEFIDKVLAYNISVSISDNKLGVFFPKDILEIINTKPSDKDFEVKPNRIEMKTISTREKRCIEFTLILNGNTNQTEFNVLNEIKLNNNPLISSDSKRILTTFKMSEIEKFVFWIYENEIIVSMTVKNKNIYRRDFTIMKQPFNINSL